MKTLFLILSTFFSISSFANTCTHKFKGVQKIFVQFQTQAETDGCNTFTLDVNLIKDDSTGAEILKYSVKEFAITSTEKMCTKKTPDGELVPNMNSQMTTLTSKVFEFLLPNNETTLILEVPSALGLSINSEN